RILSSSSNVTDVGFRLVLAYSLRNWVTSRLLPSSTWYHTQCHVIKVRLTPSGVFPFPRTSTEVVIMADRIPPDEKRCTAQSKQQGRRCRQYRVPGYTVCRYHGANPKNKGGAPKGNKNRLTTGEHESIF